MTRNIIQSKISIKNIKDFMNGNDCDKCTI
jgi:hypothetical protein